MGPFSTVRSDHFESWGRRQTWALTCAALWVALEMVRARFLTGFPWNLLGVSQCQLLSLIQISSLTGVYGISFLIVWSSVSLALAVMSLIRQPALRWAWSSELFLPLLALVAVLGFGFYRLSRPAPVEPTLKAALVQPSIPQTLIWDTTESTNRFRKLLQLSELALAAKPELLVWPESAVPNFLRYDPDLTYPAVTNLVQTHKVWLIVCADDVEPRSPQNHTDRDLFFNSSFLINPEGQFLAAYSKQRLVIFGEYVPLARWLPFLKWFTPVDEGFTPGTRPAPFVMPELQAKTSVLICFEDVFPHLARTYVEEDTDFLLNLTNDGWFRQSAAQWQHAANALFRAVENGLPLVRCANNGLTCWVDSAGRMHDVYFGNSPDIYGPGFKIVRLPRPAHGQKRPLTFYHYHGDLFGWFCVGWVMFRALLGMLPRSNKKGLVNKPVN
jgi:apolipoprotein N-acyltransferase